MKSSNFPEQVALITAWFVDWNECEQTVALYSLLKKSSPVQAKFLDQVLQQSLADCTDVKQLEAKANDEEFVLGLYSEERELVIHQLLQLLPLLQVGKSSVKKAYLQLINDLLNCTMHNGVNIEESQQLLSYSLIHPAITTEEKGTFQNWLGRLEERFSRIFPLGSSSSAAASSANIKSVSYNKSHSVSPVPSAQHSPAYTSSHSVPLECIKALTSNDIQSALPQVSSQVHVTLTPITISEPHSPKQQHCSLLGYDSSTVVCSPSSRGDNPGCSQYLSPSNGHMTLRATNSHGEAYAASRGHHPALHATSSAPPNISSLQLPKSHSEAQATNQKTHSLLHRTQSIVPPMRLQNPDKIISDWLMTGQGHASGLTHTLTPRPQHKEHAALSPQSSSSSSDIGSSEEDGPQQMRDSFLANGTGMREVPVWLKTLRLHKYSYLFKQMTYEEMLSVTEDWLEQQNVTKGARHKIYLSIVKLRNRQDLLRNLEKKMVDEGSPIKPILVEMKSMLNSPIKAFNPTSEIPTSSSSLSSSNPPAQSPTTDDVVEGDLPAQFCRLMGKVCTQLLVISRPDDDCFHSYLHLLDKCLQHEAFSSRQKNLMLSWKQSAQRIWQPPLQRYSDRPRRGYHSTAYTSGGNTSASNRILTRTGHSLMPGAGFSSQTSGAMWGIGARRSIVGGGSAHATVQRVGSLSAAFLNKPGLLESSAKQPVTRTQSVPIHNRPDPLVHQGCENANDTEINARLDSLCLSMTEHALGS